MLKLRQFTFGILLFLLSVLTVSQAGSGEKLASISTGEDHTCALSTSGKAYCWGFDFLGQLGNNSTTNSSVPVSVAPTKNGLALAFSIISAGFTHTCGISMTNNAYCWGNNEHGMLGNNSLVNSSIPVEVYKRSGKSELAFAKITGGFEHTCALTTTGIAYCWGRNRNGELGNNTTFDSETPVAVANPDSGNPLNFKMISAGDGYTCGLDTSDKTYCWGSNYEGQLGINNSDLGFSKVPMPISKSSDGQDLTFSSISTGSGRTCGLTTKGQAYCWGSNFYGALGNGNPEDSPIPVVVAKSSDGQELTFSQISTGAVTCAIAKNSKTYCWGHNESGSLGNNSLVNSNIPAQIVMPKGETDSDFSTISASVNGHVCAISLSGKTYCWGFNLYGAIGNNTTSNSSIPVLVNPLP